MPSLPKIILDTNVCGKLLVPAYCDDLEEIKRRLSRNFRIVVSFETLIELLDAIKGGDGSHFEADKRRLRLMAGNGKPIFLGLPGRFALSKALGISPANLPSVSKLGPRDFEKWFRLALGAKNRDEMLSGGVTSPVGQRRMAWVFDPDVVIRQQREDKAFVKRLLENFMDDKRQVPSPDEWATEIALALGRTILPRQAGVLANHLDAAYQYRKSLCAIVAGGAYNFERHDGDWNDYHQLFYLSDQSVHLLTDDAGIGKRIENSAQRDRVLDLRKFLKANGFTPRH